MTDDFLSIDGMTQEFGISKATAWRWVREGDLKTFRFIGDRKTYVKREDLAILRRPIEISPIKKQAA